MDVRESEYEPTAIDEENVYYDSEYDDDDMQATAQDPYDNAYYDYDDTPQLDLTE